MNLNCQDCKQQVTQALAGLPPSWIEKLSDAICDAVTTGQEIIDCDVVRECVSDTYGNTYLSEFTVNGPNISISYTNNQGVIITRTFDFTQIINSSLDNVDPNCVASAEAWSAMTYLEKWQAIIDKVCDTCVDATTTTTTSSTTTTTTETTTTSTTTTTTSV